MTAVVPSRQLTEGRNQHSAYAGVVGETGKPEPIRSLTECGRRVDVTTEIQPFTTIRRCFRFMTEPEISQAKTGSLGHPRQMQTTIVISANEKNVSVQPLVKPVEIVLQTLGETESSVNQIAENNQPSRLHLLTQPLQSIERSPVAITRQGDAACLEHLRLAQVQIGDEQLATGRSPDRLVRQQHQLLVSPVPAAL